MRQKGNKERIKDNNIEAVVNGLNFKPWSHWHIADDGVVGGFDHSEYSALFFKGRGDFYFNVQFSKSLGIYWICK